MTSDRSLKLTLRWAVLLSAGMLLAACQSVEVRNGEVIASDAIKATWERGLLFMGETLDCYFSPLSAYVTQDKCLKSGPENAAGPVPAVVFLHGCAGWGNRQEHVMKTIQKHGYVVFAPDSFARPGRVKLCGQGSAWEKSRMRLDEAAYALAKVRQFPWVDKDRIVLAGFSEGGMAVAEYPHDDVRAILILGWGCSRGIRAPLNIPVLNVVGARDRESSTDSSLCSVIGRPDSKAVNVDAGHDIAFDPQTTHIVGNFLKSVLER